jgi:tripartite-type tricarboxylate transporter receptor subunit TctC
MAAPKRPESPTSASRRTPRRTALATIAGALATPLAGVPMTGRAQPGSDWPSQAVRYINPFPPGGATDTLSRLYCAKIGEVAGRQFVVENRSGSGGIVGVEAVARSRPDGYTIGMGGHSMHAIAPSVYAKLPYDPARDFTFVSGLWRWPTLLVVSNDLPARTVPELVALLKAEPGKHAYATPGPGTSMHLSGELLKRMAGVDMAHASYRGGAPALLDLLAGRVTMLFDAISGPLRAVREGKLKALAVTSPERNPALPDVPAMAEFMPGFDTAGWTCLCGPAGLPRPVVERLSAWTKRALESPALVWSFHDLGATPWWTTPEEFAAIRDREEARFAPLVRASGVRVE